ncbi:hypothetical protein WJ96_04455 [Burkholderia ubonensis]|uniref:Glyoxalase-related protein domain-containing protein n=1 Tax=Burkholderia ubonensis TaxID=101571 RepID=A0AAW3MYE3_9BURK|nr:glyoxalase superfamily protein [Burkholderia ubonensis]KVP65624.1 hypothetical protein WJ93_24190 [Burkholderia ubonensis]KVP97827.1 hypothetical protein WJ96_04455 [Burkholderia ubonensis]KVZ92524.1 hypothetical protein WL25_16110 [Burkholderia ubonensis]
MNLPSVEFLKDQASRLVAYMGDKHRFRLRSASALEAVAAMYRQRDWNTLEAMASREAAPAAEQSYSAAGNPTVLPRSPQNTFPLMWTPRGMAEFSVSSNDWFRHTLAIGGSKQDRRIWLQQHLMAQLDQDSPGVFLNAFGGELPREVRDIFVQEGLLVDLSREDNGLTLNLMADLAADDIASMLVTVLLRSGNNPGNDYWVQASNYVLTVVVSAMQEAGRPVTLTSLMALFPNQRPAGLYSLVQALDESSPARKSLQLFLDSCGFDGESIREQVWITHYSVLMHALQRLASNPWAQQLFSDEPGAQGLFTRLSQGKCLVLESPDGSDGSAEKAVLYALRSALARRLMLPREETEKGWVFGLGELDNYLAPALAIMVEQARSARAAILMTTRDAGTFKGSPTGERLLANVWNQLYLNGCPRERLLELFELMANRPVLAQPGHITSSVSF